MGYYLIIGVLFHSFASFTNWRMFHNVTVTSFIKGYVFAVLLWPISLPFFVYCYLKGDYND